MTCGDAFLVCQSIGWFNHRCSPRFAEPDAKNRDGFDGAGRKLACFLGYQFLSLLIFGALVDFDMQEQFGAVLALIFHRYLAELTEDVVAQKQIVSSQF